MPWQTTAWKDLSARLANASLPHALLVSGVHGSGKQQFARAFAALALCRNPQNGDACGNCSACLQFAAGSHPDFHFVTPQEDKSAILVDQIRELSQSLALTSLHGGWKIALLVPADCMNANAANSLLKTLEEPAAGTLLLLLTSRPAALPATIRSRCQSVRLGTPKAEAALQWLEAHASRPDWIPLLKIAGGGPLQALEFAGNRWMQERLQYYQTLLEMRAGTRNPIRCAADVHAEDLPVVLRLLQAWISDLIILASTGSNGVPAVTNTDALPILQNALMGINLRGLHAYLDRILEVNALLATPLNRQSLLEVLYLDWSQGLQPLGKLPLAARGG
ncbi:MAG: DNA polymerase III subunit delta' [Gammaproteobacteria bacterium]|nr:DNA polymerase III subunit delta' [Gammaproteobacteria bacterium]